MKREITTTPSHIATARWIQDAVVGQLRDGDTIKDLAFRERTSAIGPSGWLLLVDITSVTFPENVTPVSGINFPKPGKPERTAITRELSSMYQKIEQTIKDQPTGLISKPQPGDISRIARGTKKMLTGAEQAG